jgi:Zn-dependent membrane protease YugP
MQHAQQYAPLVVRNAAVPIASFGSNASFLIMILGFVMSLQPLVLLGIGLFACVVVFQLINLPVEFDASARAKSELATLGIVNPNQMVYVNKVLNAAALTYVAATLQAVLTLLYYVMQFAGGRDE